MPPLGGELGSLLRALAVLKIIGKTAVLLGVLAIVGASLFATSAQAGPTIQLGQGRGLMSFDQLVDFERNIRQNTVITNQFADQGVTVIPGEGTKVRFDGCGNPSRVSTTGLSGHTISNLASNCRSNSINIDSFSLKFNSTVTAASFGYYLYVARELRPQLISTLLNGVVNSTYAVLGSGNGYAVISGGAFNEIRFVDGSATDYATFDNLAFQYASSGVPTPGALALFGLGLLGLAGLRRKQAAFAS
jgi:hypothetical protein